MYCPILTNFNSYRNIFNSCRKPFKTVQKFIMASKDSEENILSERFDTNLEIDPLEKIELHYSTDHKYIHNIIQRIHKAADIEQSNKFGSTLLINAVETNNAEITSVLLKKGANVNATLTCTGLTAFDIACYKGNIEIVSSLIKAGANTNSVNALIGAACYGHLKIVELLLSFGVNPQCESKIGLTALFYPCQNGHIDIVKLLVDSGAKVNHETKDGITPLMMACEANQLNIVQYLISKGANINHRSKYAYCNLAITDNNDIIEELLKHGAEFYKARTSNEILSTDL